ncbi:MAG: LysM domain-containing protein [Chloroflexota bacterium]
MEDFDDKNGLVWEWLKFGGLLTACVSIVVVIAFSRPFVFGRLIPAVLGEHLVIVPPPQPPADPTPPATSPTETPTAAPTTTPTPPPQPTATQAAVLTYTVQPGENLTLIAQKHGTTVEEIITLNRLSNPDQITAGTVLIIPTPHPPSP